MSVSARSSVSEPASWYLALGRTGWAGKGALYVAIGLIAILVAIGSGRDAEGQTGALETVADQPFGQVMLVVMILGLIAYALHRVLEAIIWPFDEDGVEALAHRASGFVSAAVYALVCAGGVSLLTSGGSGGRAGGGSEDAAAAKVLGLPFGPWALGVAAVILIGVGGYRASKALGRYEDDLELSRMSSAEKGVVSSMAIAGESARAVVFFLTGAFLLKAAVEFDPDEAIGLDGALRKVAEQPYGQALLGLVAAGLLAYGLYAVALARYRRFA